VEHASTNKHKFPNLSRSFAETLEESIREYQNRSIEAAALHNSGEARLVSRRQDTFAEQSLF